MASEGVGVGEDLMIMGPCHGSSQGKSPSCYGGDVGSGSMLTLEERSEKKGDRERRLAECHYPCEREGWSGGDQSHLRSLTIPPPSSIHHDQGDSTNKRSGVFHSQRSGGGLGREAHSSRWEWENQGDGEVQSSSFHLSRRPGSAQRGGDHISSQLGSRQSSSHHQQMGNIGYNIVPRQGGTSNR